MTSTTPGAARNGIFPTVLSVMLDPGGVLKKRLENMRLGVALGISGMAFLLFFLQTGIDRARAGQIGGGKVVILGLVGMLFGSVGVAAVALVGWSGARLLGSQASMSEAIRGFGLAYSPTLVYAAVGLAFNLLLGWNTAVAFGVTGLLWAMGPMIAALKEMMGGRSAPAAVLATLCGFLVLLAWARLGAMA